MSEKRTLVSSYEPQLLIGLVSIIKKLQVLILHCRWKILPEHFSIRQSSNMSGSTPPSFPREAA